jgi:hypothetical protein
MRAPATYTILLRNSQYVEGTHERACVKLESRNAVGFCYMCSARRPTMTADRRPQRSASPTSCMRGKLWGEGGGASPFRQRFHSLGLLSPTARCSRVANDASTTTPTAKSPMVMSGAVRRVDCLGAATPSAASARCGGQYGRIFHVRRMAWTDRQAWCYCSGGQVENGQKKAKYGPSPSRSRVLEN